MHRPRNPRSHPGNPQNSLPCHPDVHRDIRVMAELSNVTMSDQIREIVNDYQRRNPHVGLVCRAMRPRQPLYKNDQGGRS